MPGRDNGIRGGSGTADDPYVIANWTISSDDRDGIYVFNTSRHLVIRDVTIVQNEGRDDSDGILLERDRNVIIENVTVRGRQQRGITVLDSRPDRGMVAGEPVVIRGATLHRERVQLYSTGVHVERSGEVVVEEVNITGTFFAGVRIFDASGTVRDSYINLARRPRPPPDEFSGRYFRGTGIEYDDADIQVTGNTLARTPYLVYGPDPTPTSDVVFQGNRIVPTGDDVDALVFGAARIAVRNNTGSATYSFQEIEERALLEGNEFKHVLYVGGPATVRGNTFDGLRRCRGPGGASVEQTTNGTAIRDTSPVDEGGCRSGLNALATGEITVRRNRFRGYPTVALGIVVDEALSVRANAFHGNGYRSGCHPIIALQAREIETDAQVDQNDLLRSSASRCGVGLRVSDHRARNRTTSWQVDAMGNYWGPEPPMSLGPDEGAPHPHLGIMEGANHRIRFDPWSTEPQVLSPAFVESYFANYEPEGPGLPAPAALLVVAGLGAGVWVLTLGRDP